MQLTKAGFLLFIDYNVLLTEKLFYTYLEIIFSYHKPLNISYCKVDLFVCVCTPAAGRQEDEVAAGTGALSIGAGGAALQQ